MCQSCEWEDKLEECEALLNNSEYEFALDTLEGITEWIRANRHVTDKQANAISNIANCKN